MQRILEQHPIRILLIDDDRADRRAVCWALGNDFEVTEATTAEQAHTQLDTEEFDCILLDYRFPQFDTLKWISHIGQKTAVVILTGLDDVMVAVATMKAGAQDYLVKGKFTSEALHRAIRNAMEKVALRQQIERQQQQLENLVTTDGLTGLYNRRYFMECLRQEIIRVGRFGFPLSVLLLDLDHFKKINDEHGHLVGDRVLVHVAELMQGCLRKTDLVARYGGEEFCILAIGTNLDGAEAFGNRLRTLIEETPCPLNNAPPISVTCSIGAAQLFDRIEDAEQLLEIADRALYDAKHAGRNLVVRAS